MLCYPSIFGARQNCKGKHNSFRCILEVILSILSKHILGPTPLNISPVYNFILVKYKLPVCLCMLTSNHIITQFGLEPIPSYPTVHELDPTPPYITKSGLDTIPYHIKHVDWTPLFSDEIISKLR